MIRLPNNYFNLLLFLLVSSIVATGLCSCSGDPDTAPVPQLEGERLMSPVIDSLPHGSGKSDPVAALKDISIFNINQHIHPQKGLWLIQSSGTMPHMENLNQVDKNFPVDFSALKYEELPVINCDSKSFWSKTGCFVQDDNAFKTQKVWTYCRLVKEDEAKAEETANTIMLTVINTAHHVRYYFSLIDGKWYLTFVDLRTPCEA